MAAGSGHIVLEDKCENSASGPSLRLNTHNGFLLTDLLASRSLSDCFPPETETAGEERNTEAPSVHSANINLFAGHGAETKC